VYYTKHTNNGGEGVLDVTQGFVKEQKLVRRAFIYVSVPFCHFKNKNKNTAPWRSL
jgi:hypothetical protein